MIIKKWQACAQGTNNKLNDNINDNKKIIDSLDNLFHSCGTNAPNIYATMLFTYSTKLFTFNEKIYL